MSKKQVLQGIDSFKKLIDSNAHAEAIRLGESGWYGDQRDDFLNIRYGYEWAGRH